jgi:putative ABC transport system ATP-binding protein
VDSHSLSGSNAGAGKEQDASLLLQSVAFRYRGDQPLTFPDGVAPSGALVRLSGSSGSGKSTLLSLLAGLMVPCAGRLVVAGVDPASLTERERDAWRGANVGIVPQRLHLSPHLSVWHNLALPWVATGQAVDAARIAEVMDCLGLLGLEGRRPGELSGGQAQRVAVARALMRRPRLILADEPTASLDDIAARQALTLLRLAAEQHAATLVVATHDRRVTEAWPEALEWRLVSGRSALPGP